MQRVAVIDLGSNSARLVAFANKENKRYQLLDELREIVRLSEAMGEAKIIRDIEITTTTTSTASFWF